MPNPSPFRFTLPTRSDEQPTSRPRTKPPPPSRVSQFKQKGPARFRDTANSFLEAPHPKPFAQAISHREGNEDHNEHPKSEQPPETPAREPRAPRQFKVPPSLESLRLEAELHPSTTSQPRTNAEPIASKHESTPTTHEPTPSKHQLQPAAAEQTTPTSSPPQHTDKRRRLTSTPAPKPPSTFRPLPSFSFTSQPTTAPAPAPAFQSAHASQSAAQHAPHPSQAPKRPAFRAKPSSAQAAPDEQQAQPHLALPPDLALLFSPRKSNRHGDAFLAGGWAEQVRSWIIDAPAAFTSIREADLGAAGSVVRIGCARSSAPHSGEDDATRLVSRNRSEITPFTLAEGAVVELGRLRARIQDRLGEIVHAESWDAAGREDELGQEQELELEQARTLRLVLLSSSEGALDPTGSCVRLGSGSQWGIDLVGGEGRPLERWWVCTAGWRMMQ